ncbi:hypothetical protein SM124_23650 [Bacillus sp. 31A1R]|uniref:L,D-transpeptidase catalytic domain n=1 Tax=Robertmurraya mangrovi TaxID=3098077 RepID=A0ABU5J5J9_9BACI|nr:hypothetical protein [Bacillus sp. 31A1R]MDZ5474640.1 hypothetical protein [Bacillus sp. 31A1R]
MKKIFICLLLTLFASINIVGASKHVHKEPKIEMLPWSEANLVIPKYTKFIVKDLETGKEFNVQRRAGSQHADVQPLTTADTKIMKEIYNGKWSWKRRAIIVKYEKKRIAASMHGMPHGGGALKNNFPGHFCIHFYGSKTHRKNHMDLSHKLMVLKSAGKLASYLQSSDPYEVTSAYIAGFKEQDPKIVSLLSLQQTEWKKPFSKVENVSLTRMPVLPVEDLVEELSLAIPIEVDWYIKNEGKRAFKGNIYLVRFTPLGSWKVDTITFLEDNRLSE